MLSAHTLAAVHQEWLSPKHMVAAFSLGYRPGTYVYLEDGPYYFQFDNIHDADDEGDAEARKAKEPRHWPGGWGGYSEDDMIAAGVAEVKKDTGGGAASASDTKMDGSHKDAAQAKSSAKGKAPIPGAKASSKTSMVVEEANDSEEDGEVEEAKAPDPSPPKKMRY